MEAYALSYLLFILEMFDCYFICPEHFTFIEHKNMTANPKLPKLLLLTLLHDSFVYLFSLNILQNYLKMD